MSEKSQILQDDIVYYGGLVLILAFGIALPCAALHDKKMREIYGEDCFRHGASRQRELDKYGYIPPPSKSLPKDKRNSDNGSDAIDHPYIYDGSGGNGAWP